MSFFRARGRKAVGAPTRPVAVFAVGRRVYVAGADQSARVMLMDDADKKPLASLSDGTEVRILAWRPGWSGSTRYCVRGTDSGIEGWLPVNELRSTKVAIAPPPEVSPSPAIASSVGTTDASDAGRRFGQR